MVANFTQYPSMLQDQRTPPIQVTKAWQERRCFRCGLSQRKALKFP